MLCWRGCDICRIKISINISIFKYFMMENAKVTVTLFMFLFGFSCELLSFLGMMSRKIMTLAEVVGKTLILFVSANRRTIIIICITLAVSFPLIYNVMFVFYRSSDSKFVFHLMATLGLNETLYSNRFLNGSVSLEGDVDCNLEKRTSCYHTNKSLVVTFWRESSRNK